MEKSGIEQTRNELFISKFAELGIEFKEKEKLQSLVFFLCIVFVVLHFIVVFLCCTTQTHFIYIQCEQQPLQRG